MLGGEKSVYRPLEAFVGDGNAGLRKTLGVDLALVEERIETGGDDIGGRQPRGVLRGKRGSEPLATGSLTSQIVFLLTAHKYTPQRISLFASPQPTRICVPLC